MSADSPEAMLRLAVRLARAADDLAVARRSTALVASKGDGADVVTDVDRDCEALILAGIRDRFPDHAVLGEESGSHGTSTAAVRWLVDPLDGTNNFVMGLGFHGVCITACVEGEAVVAVTRAIGRTFAAIRGCGATVDGRPVRLGAAQPLRRTTVSWTQGYGVDVDDAARNHAFTSVERATKRVLRTWAPSVDWGLLVTGHVGGLIAYRNEPWDLVGGVLIAREAGAAIATDASGEWVVTAHPDLIDDLVAATGPTRTWRAGVAPVS